MLHMLYFHHHQMISSVLFLLYHYRHTLCQSCNNTVVGFIKRRLN